MKNITERELSMLWDCQSAQDWSTACGKIKTARGGEYPEDWWKKVKTSGMMDEILARWGRNSSLKISKMTRLPFKHTTDGKNKDEAWKIVPRTAEDDEWEDKHL